MSLHLHQFAQPVRRRVVFRDETGNDRLGAVALTTRLVQFDWCYQSSRLIGFVCHLLHIVPVCKELLKAVDDWVFQRHGLAFGNVGACLLQATDFIREQRLRVYCILAGQLLWEGPPVINTCCGMDWKRALALHLWSVSNNIIMQGCFIQNLYTPWQIRLWTERMVL